jgi:hypothetical protein
MDVVPVDIVLTDPAEGRWRAYAACADPDDHSDYHDRRRRHPRCDTCPASEPCLWSRERALPALRSPSLILHQRCCSGLAVGHAQIGRVHRRIVTDVGRRPGPQHSTVGQYRYPIAGAHDEIDLVLD